MRVLWIALGVVAAGGVAYGLYWALSDPAPRARSGPVGSPRAPAGEDPPPVSKAAGASLPHSPSGGEEGQASEYIRVIGSALGAAAGALGGGR